ncbi:MAG TPA: DUF6755 family protein [Gemmataceae bacterium]|nr:DUF6755 family protein [Gemmataceae bacterium]
MVALLVVLQLWLLMATMNVFLGGDDSLRKKSVQTKNSGFSGIRLMKVLSGRETNSLVVTSG